MTQRLISDSETLRNVTASWWANADFSRIDRLEYDVEQELATVIGTDTMEWLTSCDGRAHDAWLHAATAVGYMACLRYYRLNDISHDTGSRRVKIDRDNEARPFEWQLARDDRAHLEEYYRALDRLIDSLQENETFRQTKLYKRTSSLIVKDADSLSYLTGLDPSPWLYLRLLPFLDESQRFVAKAYGMGFREDMAEAGEELQHAAQMAVALGAIALMGRRTSLQTLPYGLMKIFESDGGGNRKEAAALDRLDDYLKHLSKEQHYWLNEMKQLRDEAAGTESPSRLQMPDNDPHNKYMRL